MIKKLLLLTLILFVTGFSSRVLGQYVLNGSATQTGGCFTLTPAIDFRSGSVWYLNKVNINDPFDIYFDVFFGCVDVDGADGLAFVLQQVSTSVGSAGEGIGYQGIAPSLAVEFDTWQNNNQNDPVNDHVAIMKNGIVNHNTPNNLAGPTSIIDGVSNAEDCQWHKLRMTWNPDTMIMRVYIDCVLRLTYQGDIINDIFNGDPEVFWGFTSATGGSNNEHKFCLDYISFVESLNDTAVCRGQSVQLFAGSGSSYLWTPSTGLNSDTIAAPIATPDSTTTYLVEIQNACNAPRFDSVTVYVQDSVEDIFTVDYNLCSTGEVEIEPPYPFATYSWPDGSVGPSWIVSDTGTYITDITNLCASFTDTFSVGPALLPEFRISDLDCFGDNDGQATLVLPNPSSRNFTWGLIAGPPIRIGGNGQAADSVQNLLANDYWYLVEDTAGCVYRDTFSIVAPPELDFGPVAITDVLCGGASTGQIVASATGGTGNYLFSINGGTFQADSAFGSLSAGNYIIRVRDDNDCETNVTYTVAENDPILVSIDASRDNTCFGDLIGTVDASGSGGVGQLSFSLDQTNFQANGSFTGLAAATYVMTIRDSLGCEQAQSFQIDEPAELIPVVDRQQNIDCNGNANGQLVLGANGGSPVYQFNFEGQGFGSDSLFENLAAGMYTFEVQDDSGCISIDSVEILEPTPLTAALNQIVDVACFGDSTGSVSLTGQGGSAPYRYGFDPAAVSADSILTGLPRGIFVITVVDDSNCVTTISAEVEEPPLLVAQTVDRQDVECSGGNTGILEVAGSGGTLPYTYAITNTGNVGTGFVNSPVFDSLFAGIYTLQVMDEQGCVAEVDTIIGTPTNLIGGIDSLVDVSCFGGTDGGIFMSASGGTAPYEYSFDGVNFSPGPVFNNLSIQQDTVILRDNNNCIIPIPFIINQPDSLVPTIVNTRDLACFNGNTGSIEIGLTGGVMPYQYSINGSSLGNEPIFDSLFVGAYTFDIVDANGCTAEIDTFLTQPDSLQLQVVFNLAVACFGEQNGQLELAGLGGVGNYQLSIDSSAFQPIFLYDSLSAGTYQIQIQDDSSCVTVQNVEVVQPDTLILQVDSIVDVSCFGENSGSVLLNVSGGNGGNIFSDPLLGQQDTTLFDSLFTGIYAFEVLDSRGCRDTVSAVVNEPPLLEISLAEQIDVDCFGNGNGSILSAASGGTMPYLFILNQSDSSLEPLFANLVPGDYAVSVIDANGCTQVLDSLEMTEPDTLITNLAIQDVLCFGESSGSLQAVTQGGTQPYSFDWNGFPQTNGDILANIPVGFYEIVVTDSNGCVDVAEAVINQPDTLVLFLDSLQEAHCDLANGYASVFAEGGISSYIYNWVGTDIYEGDIQTGILGGEFLVTVTDQNGCTDTLNVIVPEDPPSTALFEATPSLDQPFLLSQARDIDFLNLSDNNVQNIWDMDAPMGLFDTENVNFGYDEAGTYVISLTTYNKYFTCPTTFTDTLLIIPDGNINVPNAFTPNQDGINEEFAVWAEGVVDFEMIILNRWGREVARLTSIQDGWDGKSPRGVEQPEGVYVYRMRALLNSGEEVDQAGTITLIR
ncbi:MAG: gliding motility-associated C-terminal domain-containing protein [Bacteroidota bacterium]